MAIINEQHVKQDWQNRGFSFGVWIDPPEQAWNDFVHETDELLILIEGELELIIEEQCFYPKIGEEILISATIDCLLKHLSLATKKFS